MRNIKDTRIIFYPIFTNESIVDMQEHKINYSWNNLTNASGYIRILGSLLKKEIQYKMNKGLFS